MYKTLFLRITVKNGAYWGKISDSFGNLMLEISTDLNPTKNITFKAISVITKKLTHKNAT